MPLTEAYAVADHVAKASSYFFLVFLCLLLSLTGMLLNVLILQPLKRAKIVAKRIADDPTQNMGERVPSPKGRELAEFAQAFNSMADTLAKERALLDARVAERTRELAEANGKLQRLSERDGLTGLYNRRKFDLAYATAWDNALKQRQPLSIILLDVDDFKNYNDQYGHQAGDDCLRQVAEVLETTVRGPDALAARYGGEEFVVILPGLTGQAARTLAQEICRVVAGKGVCHAKTGAPSIVTISAGVAGQIPEAGETAEHMLEKADAVLYVAKASGKNCCILAD
ncbi:Two-component response regulator [Desulfovibrio sp. TomC]|nr:Two-component response regulator [Desulfovibrio sp. TomC]